MGGKGKREEKMKKREGQGKRGEGGKNGEKNANSPFYFYSSQGSLTSLYFLARSRVAVPRTLVL